LQIGTNAAWGAGRAAATLFPGLACLGAAVMFGLVAGGGNDVLAIPLAIGVLFVVYACFHTWRAVKTRASDLLLFPGGVHVEGGRLDGARIGWNELSPPFAHVEEDEAMRLTVWRILLFAITLASRSNRTASPLGAVTVWKLWVHRAGRPELVAETDRPIEADSMRAAAASIEAVVAGRRYVAEAPAIPAQITACGACGAPAIPDDAPAVACRFCRAWIPLPPHVRGQAAATKAMAQSRGRTAQMVARLLDQPRAGRSNAWLLFFAAMMFGAWPVGWGAIAWRVLSDGFQIEDIAFLLFPFAAVLAGFFFARGRLADRGALQMLTLGFGALAPRRDGEPARCRRCQGPLPDAGLGGVTQCRYCAAENIVGLDLRPSVDRARVEQVTFDEALKKRGRERLLWGLLTGIAVLSLLAWVSGTTLYLFFL
jgi:hypothetical protein